MRLGTSLTVIGTRPCEEEQMELDWDARWLWWRCKGGEGGDLQFD